MDDRELEARARAAFDASVEGLDAATRSRLTQARHRALAARGARPAWQAIGVPAGAAAAVAVLAVAMWTGREPDATAPQPAAVQGEMFDLLAAGEDFELLGEDPEFYAWVETQDDVS